MKRKNDLLIMILSCLLVLLLFSSCGASEVNEIASEPAVAVEKANPTVENNAPPTAEVQKIVQNETNEVQNEVQDEAKNVVPDNVQNVEQHSGKTVEEMLAEKNAVVPELTVDGSSYGRKDSVSTYLFMGIDESGMVPASNQIVNGGQCDVVMLLVVDKDAGKYTKIQLDRDMMVDMDVMDFYGNVLTTTTQQLCFAHSYGNGTEASCENVARCVSRLFGDTEIDGYVSVRYEGIPAVNDTLGGICVKIEDDFSEADETLVMGETVELTGNHALNYLRGRMSVGGGTNSERMSRHRSYLNAFSARLKETLHGNSAIINDLYQAAKPFMVTNMSSGELTELALLCNSYSDCGVIVPKGTWTTKEYKNGNTYVEYRADEAALQEMVLDLYYVPAK